MEGTIDTVVALTAPEEATVVDGGGHNGETLTLLAHAFQNKPKTHFHVFEPSVSAHTLHLACAMPDETVPDSLEMLSTSIRWRRVSQRSQT